MTATAAILSILDPSEHHVGRGIVTANALPEADRVRVAFLA